MIAELLSESELAAARDLVERNGLAFEARVDNLFGIYEQEQLVAVGARAGNVLKMLAVEPSHQGGALLGVLVTALVASGFSAGHESLFVYTKPEHIGSFEALNFTLLARVGKAALLEYGKGLRNWLESKRALLKPGVKGAIVMNANPFTFGHRYLVETAARQVDHLYLFIVREERSAFPFAVRLRLAQDALADLDNVTILDTANYLVSSATFPTYFLKKDDPVARIQMELDVTLFATKIAPFFGISRRFVGSEPLCPLTHHYNATMRDLLPAHGVALVEIDRQESASGVISASRVRELLARNDISQLTDYVPASTLAFLLSDECSPIRQQLEMTSGGSR